MEWTSSEHQNYVARVAHLKLHQVSPANLHYLVSPDVHLCIHLF